MTPWFLFLFLAEDTKGVSTHSSSVQRNIVLFQGFCAMKYAIYALCVNAHKYSNCVECESIHKHQPSTADMDQNKTSSEGLKTCFLLCSEVLLSWQIISEFPLC